MIKTILMALVAVPIMTVQAGAATVFDGGGAATLSTTVTDGVEVDNSTDLTVETGANVSTPPAISGITVLDTSTVTVNDGVIVGGSGTATEPAGHGISADEGTVVVNGGQVTGGEDGTSGFPGDGIRQVRDDPGDTIGDIIVNGGVITGGDTASIDAGVGITQVDITGDAGTLQINGGTVRGGNGFSSTGVRKRGGEMVMTAGVIEDGVSLNNVDFTLSGGLVSDELVLQSGSTFNMSGGTFNGGVKMIDSIVNLTGGEIFGPIEFFGGNVLNVFGKNLQFSGGTITGRLQDGSLINLSVIDSFGVSTVNLIDTPITGTIPLPMPILFLASGLVALGGLRCAGTRRAA